MNYCQFGSYLYISRETLEIYRTAREDGHSVIMHRIFECWNRKVMDRTWRQVLSALTEVGYCVLANEIGNKLISCNERTTDS